MKNLFALLLLCSSIFGGKAICHGSEHPNEPNFHGPYVGFNIGRSLAKTEFKYITPLFSKRNTVTAQGLEGGFLLGYMHRIEDVYVSGEGLFNLSGGTGKASFYLLGRGHYASEKVSHKYNVQLRSSVGYIINNYVAPKIILGWGHFKFKNYLLNVEGKQKMNTNSSFIGGFGIDFIATKHILLGFEYITSLFAKNKSINFPFSKVSSKMNYEKFSFTFKYLF